MREGGREGVGEVVTCAMDADPKGLSSNSRNKSDSSAPLSNSRLTMA